MENLPMIFETGLFITLIIMLVLAVVATGSVITFRLRDLRATKRLIRERLWKFVRLPWMATDSYYRDCGIETKLKFNPYNHLTVYVDSSIPKPGSGLTWATALKDPKEALKHVR